MDAAAELVELIGHVLGGLPIVPARVHRSRAGRTGPTRARRTARRLHRPGDAKPDVEGLAVDTGGAGRLRCRRGQNTLATTLFVPVSPRRADIAAIACRVTSPGTAGQFPALRAAAAPTVFVPRFNPEGKLRTTARQRPSSRTTAPRAQTRICTAAWAWVSADPRVPVGASSGSAPCAAAGAAAVVNHAVTPLPASTAPAAANACCALSGAPRREPSTASCTRYRAYGRVRLWQRCAVSSGNGLPKGWCGWSP